MRPRPTPPEPTLRLFVPEGRVPPPLRGEGIDLLEITTLAGVDPGEEGACALLLDGVLAAAGGVEGVRDLPPEVAVVSLDGEGARVATAAGRLFLSLAGEDREDPILRGVRAALEHAAVLRGAAQAQGKLDRIQGEFRELTRVGMALMSERDPDRLLGLILTQARRLTLSDAGSLYLVEEGDEGEHLRFRLAQNDSLPDLPAPDFTLPIDRASLAGYVAATGEDLVIDDVYDLPDDTPFTFNTTFDENFGYRAQSMLVVPMTDHRDRMVGVVQLINRKRRADGVIRDEAGAKAEVVPYGERDVEIVRSLAGQAAVSIENGQLYRSIEHLFEGFIKAAVTAIDQRDPTTSGHSVRVATLTCDLAEVADRAVAGPFREVRFTREQMKELRYAGLLHDFGKVGVREEVLVKSKKLPPVMLERIESRFDLIRRTLEAEFHRQRAELLMREGPGADPARLFRELEGEYRDSQERVDRFQAAVREANEPRVLPEESAEILHEIAATRFPDLAGDPAPYITGEELHFLRIPKGSLDPEERLQIESHVTHTYNFLQQIPWTEDLANVAAIAHGHHEKLDGTGYPLRLGADAIPMQTRMMTVSDIFDALTASDRPYKKAMPAERAISILEMEAKDGQLDGAVVQLLTESSVFRKILEEDWRTF